MSATLYYSQREGLCVLARPGQKDLRMRGYAGWSVGRNNPMHQGQKNLGPLPRNTYRIDGPYTDPTKGPVVFRLVPIGTEPMYGRGGFLIHGDNAEGNASRGCIILPRTSRDLIAKAKPWRLVVVLDEAAMDHVRREAA